MADELPPGRCGVAFLGHAYSEHSCALAFGHVTEKHWSRKWGWWVA